MLSLALCIVSPCSVPVTLPVNPSSPKAYFVDVEASELSQLSGRNNLATLRPIWKCPGLQCASGEDTCCQLLCVHVFQLSCPNVGINSIICMEEPL
jgi:hypothetical protein